MARLFRPRRRRRDQELILRNRGGSGATLAIRVEMALIRNNFLVPVVEAMLLWRSDFWLSRPRRKRGDFPDQCGDGATIQTKVDTSRPRTNSSRPWWKRCGCRAQSGDGATFQTKQRWRDYSDQGGDGASKNQFFASVMEAVWLWRSDWRRREFPHQGGNGATFRTKAEMARLFRPWRRQRDQEPILRDRGGDSATFWTKAGTARLLDRCGDGVTKKRFSWPRWERRSFDDQSGDGATSRPRRRHARLSRPKRRRRDFSDQGGHDLAKFLKNFL